MEGEIENAYQYQEEMTQVIAMSCVPEDISSITNQVEQL